MKVELTLDEIKQIEIRILDHIDKVCKENGIVYYLDSGTLLGAVRHKGFIPWDDDIDIVIDRKDYQKLISLINQSNSQYKALSMYTDSNYPYPFAKIVDSETELIEHVRPLKNMGVFVDVFPLDHLPDGKALRRLHQFYVKMMLAFMRTCLDKEAGKQLSSKRSIMYLLAKKTGWKGIQKKLDDFLTKSASKNTGFKTCVVASSNPYRDVPDAYFSQPTIVTFEEKQYYAPQNYKGYLAILYGENYMQPPPEHARVSNHDFKAYKR